MIPARRLAPNVQEALRSYEQSRLELQRNVRLSWWSHWAALAELFSPRRYRWFVTPQQWNRGSPMNQSIVDETGLLAARTLATGLLSGLTSPTKPWFRLGIHGARDMPPGAEKEWLATCTERMLEVYAGSNLYTALGTAYRDNAVFGSAALIQYEDPETVVYFLAPALGEFMFGLDARLRVSELRREFAYTVQECVDQWGLENLSPATQMLYKTGQRDMEVVICHAIEPNDVIYSSGEAIGWCVPKHFKYREVHWEQVSASGTSGRGFVIGCSGFHEKPFVGLRWDVTSNDPYGSSPGMDALPAVRQLQVEQRRKAEGIDKQVRPPMIASVSMRNEPTDITAGGVTYCADVQNSGFKPAFTVTPQVQELKEDILVVQQRVKDIFFNDLFRMISDLQTVRSATEIDARLQEKLVLLGPVIERTETEGLDQIIMRTFAIMQRRGLFPPMPASLQGKTINIEYSSMLAAAQRAASTAAIERLGQFTAGLVAVQPDAMDNLNTDAIIDKYGDLLNVDPALMHAANDVAAIRQARAAQQQQAAALQTGMAAAQGAQTLSKTDVGGGKNALQAMMEAA